MIANFFRTFASSKGTSNRQIPSLDGIRGMAVLLVLIDHAKHTLPGMDQQVEELGAYGVFLFFALSAFLLTLPFCNAERSELASKRVWLNYAMRRFLRIFPLFALVLLATPWIEPEFGRGDLWNHLLMRDGRWHFWTIPVEVKFYFLLPLLVIAAGYFGGKKWWQGALALLLLYIFSRVVFVRLDKIWSLEDDFRLREYLPIFLCGSMAAVIHWFLQTRQILTSRAARIGCELAAWVCLAAMLLRIPAFGLLSENGIELIDDDVNYFAVIWPALLLAHLHGTGFMKSMFESAALRAIGVISYSVYLWHRLILEHLRYYQLLPIWAQFAGFLVLVLALSSISYFLLERPLSRIRLRRRNPVPLPESAAASF